MKPIARLALLLASGAATLSGMAGCGGELPDPTEEAPLGSSSAPVTCNPSLRRYPVAGPHNNGYDANWSVFACTPGGSCVSNSDFVAGSHLGNDIFAARGTPVVAPVDGTISYSFTDSTGGNVVYVVDDCGWWYYHAHLDSVASGLYIGQRVAAGTQIGALGNTGSAAGTSPHLHFSIYPGSYSQAVNPFPYLSAVESTACGGGPVTTTPAQPTGLSPDGWANAGSSSVVLSWSPAAGATSYEVYIVYWNGSAWTYYYTYNPTANQTTFWPYYRNTYYAWVAKGKNAAGIGPQSAWAYFYFN
jgi:hypothetical protein